MINAGRRNNNEAVPDARQGGHDDLRTAIVGRVYQHASLGLNKEGSEVAAQ